MAQAGKKTLLPDLLIEAAMVNPPGKAGRIFGQVQNDLLNKEWVQLRNLAERPIFLNGIELRHLVYENKTEPRFVTVFRMQGQLPPDRRLRIHSGQGQPSFDKQRKLYHVYMNPAEKRFNYQIVKNDTIALALANGTIVDQGHYAVPVEEGVRLVRVPPVVNQQLAMKVREPS